MRLGTLISFVLSVYTSPLYSANTVQSYDVVVYGGTSAGVIAAVQAARMGKSVVIVCTDKHLGGLSSGGLGWTDTGKKEVIGGLSREFYHRIWQHYQRADAWPWQHPVMIEWANLFSFNIRLLKPINSSKE